MQHQDFNNIPRCICKREDTHSIRYIAAYKEDFKGPKKMQMFTHNFSEKNTQLYWQT